LISIQEKYDIIKIYRKKLQECLLKLEILGEKHMLITHEFSQQFCWMLSKYSNDKLIIQSIENFELHSNTPKKTIIKSHGFECIAPIEQIADTVCFLPFLQNYQNISILVFDEKYFFTFDHHLTFCKVIEK
jgi:hypothetical protein